MGVSFWPPSLLDMVKDFARAQSPRTNASTIVCLALREFFERRGLPVADTVTPVGVSSEILNRVQEAQRLGVDVEAVLVAALKGKNAA